MQSIPQWVSSRCTHACHGHRAVGTTTMLATKHSSPDLSPLPGTAPMGPRRFLWESSQWEREMHFTVSLQQEKNLSGSSGHSPKAAGCYIITVRVCGHGPRGWWVAAGAALVSLALSSQQCGWIYHPGLLPPPRSSPAGQTPSVLHSGGQHAQGRQVSPYTRAQPKPLTLQPLPRGSHGETEAWEKSSTTDSRWDNMELGLRVGLSPSLHRQPWGCTGWTGRGWRR